MYLAMLYLQSCDAELRDIVKLSARSYYKCMELRCFVDEKMRFPVEWERKNMAIGRKNRKRKAAERKIEDELRH